MIAPVIIAAIISAVAGLAGSAAQANAQKQAGAQGASASARDALNQTQSGQRMNLSGQSGQSQSPLFNTDQEEEERNKKMRLGNSLFGSGYMGM